MVGERYTEFPQNYESLVTNLLRLKEVVFVTLNYDTLLDGVLETVDPPVGGMGWYIRPDRHWALVKLHGSVNWAYPAPMGDGRMYRDPPEDLQYESEIVLRPATSLFEVRGFIDSGRAWSPGSLYFPALSVPIGAADELVCPGSHVGFLRERLAESQPLHLLFVGYSGNDREVLSLIRDSGRGIRTMTIVDRSYEAAELVSERLAFDHGLHPESVTCVDGDFNSWIESGGLAAFVADMATRSF